MQRSRINLRICALLLCPWAISCTVDVDDVLEGDSETEADTAGDTDGDTETVADSDTQLDNQEDSESEWGTEHDTDTVFSSDTIADTATESDYATDYDTDTDSCIDTCTCCADTESESDVDTDEDTESETEEDTDVDTESESETTLDTDVDTESETEVDTSMDTETESESEVDTGFDTDPESLCTNTGGDWVAESCTGHFVCGFPPICDTQGQQEVIIPGCNCGPGMMFNPFTGCTSSSLCTALDCEDLGGLNTTFGQNVECPFGHEILGWYVRNGSCEPARGCASIGGSIDFFSSRDACNSTCNTPQKLCMTTGGVWMLDLACDHYDCGMADQESCGGVGLQIVCNCGPEMIYTEGVGCQLDPTCPPPSGGSCPTYDFGTEYEQTCGPIPLAGHYGLRNGIPCSTIFGCPADFDPVTGFVNPDDWYDDLQECLNDCAGCSSDADCDTGAGEFCQFSQAMNCGAWGTGNCVVPDAVCAQIYDPVCGCDGEHVSSLCHLNSGQGNSLAYDGECFSFPGF